MRIAAFGSTEEARPLSTRCKGAAAALDHHASLLCATAEANAD